MSSGNNISNKIDKEVSKLSYTSRDYMSIFEDLVNSIPTLTTLWTSRDEADPGIVLVKLMSMLGDMLSFNLDKQALETYPGSVTQRKNAAQIFGLIGYKMHWYRSARATVLLANSSQSSITIPVFTRFMTSDGSVYYTNTEQIEVGGGTQLEEVQYELVQGVPRTPAKIQEFSVGTNVTWHSMYGYNVFSRDIVNNEYYLEDSNVDETTIRIVDSTGEEWHQVENLELQISTGKYFELKIDEYDRPYIKFISYWEKYGISQFKLFYIVSDGSKGEVAYGMLNKLASSVYSVQMSDSTGKSIVIANTNLNISNYASTVGYDPETPDEARISSMNYVNTYDTLVTLDDFTKATKRVAEVANAIALDCTNDPILSLNPSENTYIVKIYIVRTEEYESDEKEVFKQELDTYLRQYKMMPLDLQYIVEDEGIDFYWWTVEGNIYLDEPVNTDKAKEIIFNINNQLKYSYSARKIDFNSEIKFIDVVDTIKNVDPLIHYVDINPIKYLKYDKNTDKYTEVDKSEVSGELTRTFNVSDIDPNGINFNFNLYGTTSSNPPITPGSIIIRLDSGSNMIYDNSNGGLLNYGTLLNGEGSIDYKTGQVQFELNAATMGQIVVTFKKNVISMPRYTNLSPDKFSIANESLLKGN